MGKKGEETWTNRRLGRKEHRIPFRIVLVVRVGDELRTLVRHLLLLALPRPRLLLLRLLCRRFFPVSVLVLLILVCTSLLLPSPTPTADNLLPSPSAATLDLVVVARQRSLSVLVLAERLTTTTNGLLPLLTQKLGRRLAVLGVHGVEKEVVDDFEVAVEFGRDEGGGDRPDELVGFGSCARYD